MATFATITLGCKVNTYETKRYEEGLLALGYTQVASKAYADIYIINTCAVTNTAASKSRQMIHRVKAINPAALTAVVGCYAQMESEKLIEEGVDVLIGSAHKDQLPQMIHDAYTMHRKTHVVEAIRSIRAFEALPIHRFQHQTRAYLKVQDGCNQFCTYCIIPFTRGAERSLPLQQALGIAEELVHNGHREIVLSGIHTGRYGRDIGTDLETLISALCTIEGLQRIRISSIEINEISDRLIALMEKEPKIARHLHIPLQSGSDEVLARMGRPYDTQQFEKRVEMIRLKIPDVSISTDVIVGFPMESEEAFAETLCTCKRVGFSFLHVFPYSKRSGTKAASMDGQIKGDVKKARAKALITLSEELLLAYKKQFIGKTLSVLFERVQDGIAIGHSSEYLQVGADASLVSKFCDVSITHLSKEGILIGNAKEV